MITVSDTASRRIREILDKNKAPEGTGLRISVDGGGCSGYMYNLDLSLPKPGDKTFGEKGAPVYLDPKGILFLFGSQLDYQGQILDSGFRIKNPNAKETCGCGESFVV